MPSPAPASDKSPARTPASGPSRDLPLEALRGLAALVVVVWHFLLGLDPVFLADPGYGFRGTPFFAFIHGTAAVGVFFVLSGYVLTRRYFETGQKRVLVIGALKRWFRLFLPVFLSVMLSWFLFHFDLYAYGDAAAISRSDWLQSFGFAMDTPFDPTFPAALLNGLSEAFYHQKNCFNPLLWTIHIELMGSYTAFAFAALVRCLRGHNGMIALMALTATLLVHFIEPYLSAFLAGTLLAFYAPRFRALKNAAGLGCLVLGLVFLGYREPAGFYSFLFFLEPADGDTLLAYSATVGAVFIMIAFIGFEPLRRRLQGKFAQILGRLSFPIYLVHILLLFSLGSTVFVLARDSNTYGVSLAITALALAPAIVAVAALFAVIDIQWIAFVNRIFRRVRISD